MRVSSSVSRRRARGAVVVFALLTALLPSAGGGAIAADPSGAAATAESSWTVTPFTDDGRPSWRVTWHGNEPLRHYSLAYSITADGEALGEAKVAGDRRSASVVTDDGRLVDGQPELALLYGGVDVRQIQAAIDAVAPERVGGSRPSAAGAVYNNVDPGVKGPYTTRERDYSLGRTLKLPSLPNKVELTGRIYWPANADRRRPVVVFLHGAHPGCYPEAAWPCPPGTKPVPSYRGYGLPARLLASHGYVVLSLSANGVNAQDRTLDWGMRARGELVLAHLDHWKRWSRDGSGPLGDALLGKMMFRNVGLMGHSRGGEGVVRTALLNNERGHPYGIRAVLPLAPTNYGKHTLPGVAMSVMLPYCDGDVHELQGQTLFDDSRYSLAGDRAHKSTIQVMGANHNYFNTEWTPGRSVAPSNDDWWGSTGGANAVCHPSDPRRLTAVEQERAGAAYIAGFFRLHLGGETALLPLFDGSGARARSASPADVRVYARNARRLLLAKLDGRSSAVTSRGLSAVWCRGTQLTVPTAGALPPCATEVEFNAVPHWWDSPDAPRTPTLGALMLSWTRQAGAATITIPSGRRNLSALRALTFRAGADPKVGTTDLRVQLVDGAGRRQSVLVSDHGRALQRLPGDAFMLPRRFLQGVHIPLARFDRVNLRQITQVRLLPAAEKGRVWISDLMAQGASIGPTSPDLPGLRVTGGRIKEGDVGPRFARFTLSLSRASRQVVSAHVQASLLFIGEDEGNYYVPYRQFARRVTIPAGTTTKTIDVPISVDDVDDEDYILALTSTQSANAAIHKSMGLITVQDDDPTPALTITPATAVEGDGPLRWQLSLSQPSGRTVVVFGQVVGGSAAAGSDYADLPGIEGYIEPGQTTSEMVLEVVDDAVAEDVEAMSLNVSVGGATYAGPSSVSGTITDDD